MRKFIILFLAVASSGLLLISCEKQTIDFGSGDTPYNPKSAGDSIRFSTVIIPLFAAHCFDGCHDAGQTPDLTSANAYASLTATPGQYINTAAPASSFLITHIQDSGHGGGTFASNVTDPILQWITQGARNN
ncbi:MAG: hypothetical protein WCQ95_06245 [Bacteroidota bacterium]